LIGPLLGLGHHCRGTFCIFGFQVLFRGRPNELALFLVFPLNHKVKVRDPRQVQAKPGKLEQEGAVVATVVINFKRRKVESYLLVYLPQSDGVQRLFWSDMRSVLMVRAHS
jgi:hypothetical protein